MKSPLLLLGTGLGAIAVSVVLGADSRDPGLDAVKSFEELTRLLITLTTGTLVLAPTLIGIMRRPALRAILVLAIAAICLVISMIAGIFTLSALTGTQADGHYSIASRWITWPATIQWIFFLAGVIVFSIFGLNALRRHSSEEVKTKKWPRAQRSLKHDEPPSR